MAREVSMRLRLHSQRFTRQVQEAKGKLGGLGQTARAIGGRISDAIGKGLDRLAVPSTVLGGLGIGTAMRELVQFDRQLAAVRVNADASAAETALLRQRILSLSGATTGQSASELLAGVEELLAADSDLLDDVLSTDLLQRIGEAATATGSDIKDLARTAFQLQNAFQIDSSQIGSQLDMLATMGKKGAFELRDIAEFLPEVGANMARIGQVGPQGLARTAAALQVVRRSTGSASTAANNLVNLIGFLQSPEAAKRLSQLGIKVFDDEGQTRDLFALLDEIAAVTDGGANQQALSSIFTDKQAREGAAALVKDLKDLKALSATRGNGVLGRDAAEIGETTAQALKNLRSELFKLADKHLAPWIGKLTELAQLLVANPGMLEAAFATSGVVVGVAMLRRLLQGVGNIVSGGRSGGVVGAVRGAQPVEVVNWPIAFGAAGGVGVGDAAAGALGGKVSQVASKAGKGAFGLGRAGLGLAGSGALAGLSKVGAGGLASTLGGGVAAAGGAAIGGTVAAGGLIGVGAGTAINKWVLPESFKVGLQNAMAYAMTPFSEDARRLVREIRDQRVVVEVDGAEAVEKTIRRG
jgi:TP901 family phage tail tape measure protein